ncbi:703_t:CDS:2 [Ambispora leptoticha]|uniref:703_t:CDS:1 n=1 Tax=Ambispora leptoticha TaxID=144679 RepID=A0A9N9CUW4_9GLOM|nr:703_t:CDS:2 [Ambispora leptoticha]
MSKPQNFKTIFEFILNKKSLGTKTFYSPLLSAPSNIHWQLEFNPVGIQETRYCSIFLNAIPNKCEKQNKDTIWRNRENLKPSLSLKNYSNDYLYSTIVDRLYDNRKLIWGEPRFYANESLPETFVIGVEFNTDISEEKPVTDFIDPKKNHQLKNAWLSDLNNPNTSDVRFLVEDKEFYASSKILSAQSEYFQALFRDNWKDMTNRYAVFNCKIVDTHPKLFLQMLKYLYTGDVVYESPCFLENAIDLYGIADKYLLDELREQTMEHIVSSMTVENAAEILFGSAYKWPALKREVKKFVVNNFASIAETSNYEHIIKNRNNYPNFYEINTELLLNLHQRDI